MTASENRSPFVTPETIDAANTTAVGTEWRNSGPVSPSQFRVSDRVRRAFDSMLVQPLKTRIRLNRDVALLYEMDGRELQDIGINRTDIAAIRAGMYMRDKSDNPERIVSRPEVGKSVTQADRLNLIQPTSSRCTETIWARWRRGEFDGTI